MTGTVIFLGPSLKPQEARAILDADYRPPAQRGDVLRAVENGADVIGLVDGFTHMIPAVTHKEVLFALSRGVQVYGAASLGALRAAELAPYGMIGVGRIWESYCTGEITSDEVAISHGPMELGYCPVSEAMVNIRATISAAVAAGLLERSADMLLKIARDMHFADRTWTKLMNAASQRHLPADELDFFDAWLPTGRIDQKRLDAIAMLEAIADWRQRSRGRRGPTFEFRPTQPFSALYQIVASPDRHTATAK